MVLWPGSSPNQLEKVSPASDFPSSTLGKHFCKDLDSSRRIRYDRGCAPTFIFVVFSPAFFVVLFMTLMLCLFMACMVTCLFCYHTYLMFTNLTTWESMAWHRISYLKVCYSGLCLVPAGQH